MKKIFVSIASYRDPELCPTVKNMLENAKNPEDLRITIAWQHSKEDSWDEEDKQLIDRLVLGHFRACSRGLGLIAAERAPFRRQTKARVMQRHLESTSALT